MLHIDADAQRKLPTWHFGGTNRPNDFASIWVYVYSVRIDFGLRIKGHGEAPEAIAQDMVSGNANLGIVLDMELQSLGYLCVAEQPLVGVIVLVGIRYALGGEADASRVGDGIVAHGRGIALLGCDVDFGMGITKDFVLATTGKNYREDSYNSYYHPTYGGGDFKYTYTMFFHNFFILIDLALS